MDGSPPGSSLHGILQARILEWVAMPSSRGIVLTLRSNPRPLHCRQILYHWTTGEDYMPETKQLQFLEKYPEHGKCQTNVSYKKRKKPTAWFGDSKPSNCVYFYFKIASYRFVIQISYWTSELHKQNRDNFMVVFWSSYW